MDMLYSCYINKKEYTDYYLNRLYFKERLSSLCCVRNVYHYCSCGHETWSYVPHIVHMTQWYSFCF